MEDSSALEDLKRAVEASGLKHVEIARRVRKPGGGHYTGQWLGKALKGGISLRHAEIVAAVIGYSLQLVQPGDAVDAYRRALRANNLGAEATRILWSAFMQARSEPMTQDPVHRPKKLGAGSSRLSRGRPA